MAALFLSCVTREFGSYREVLAADLELPGVRVEWQERFRAYGDRTLLMLDDYIQACDAVIHLVGDQAGVAASQANLAAILKRYGYERLEQDLGLSPDVIQSLTYTQWEAWLAVLHRRKLYVCTPAAEAARDSIAADPVQADQQRQCQQRHLQLLRQQGRYAENACRFSDASRLSVALLRALREVLPSPAVPVSPDLPPSIGRLFKGREQWLVRLREALWPLADQQVDARRVAVWGVGGLGKTRLAVEYAHTFGHRHSALLAITANTAEDLRAGVADLAGCLRLAQAASADVEVRYNAALDWLADPAHRNWFLLVDNVDDERAFRAVEALIRRLRYGQVVVTGRLRDWPQYVTDLHLDVLDADSATAYLLEATEGRRIVDSAGDDSTRAAELAHRLDGLALALVQAAGAIRKRALSFAGYLEEWDTRHEQLLDDADFNPVLTGYPRTVATTWLTSYEQLSAAGKLVFDALCWLAPDPIPERLITQTWPDEVWDLVPGDLRGPLASDARRLVLLLYDFCLADAPADAGRRLQVHRLMQDVGRVWQRKAGTDTARLRLMAALVDADFVREGIEHLTLHILPRPRELAPHVLALLDRQRQLDPVICCRFHRTLSDMRWHEGVNAEALRHGELAIQFGRAAVAASVQEEHVQTELAAAFAHLIFVLATQGQTDESLRYALEAIQFTSGWEFSNSGTKTERRAWILQELGRVRENKGEQDKALELFEQSRQIRAELCAREPDNLAHQRDLGIALFYCGHVHRLLGNRPQAVELLQQAAAAFRSLLHNASFGDTAGNLAIVAGELRRAGG
ncbi:MAG: tetratricopeptide repeat protein [Pirellulaceae bacterium]|nr:tetratricopeptide repeat protein [Pirellulaceae bacterium]